MVCNCLLNIISGCVVKDVITGPRRADEHSFRSSVCLLLETAQLVGVECCLCICGG